MHLFIKKTLANLKKTHTLRLNIGVSRETSLTLKIELDISIHNREIQLKIIHRGSTQHV